jgi:hypothetical protein
MKRVLSDKTCESLIANSLSQEWERVETVGHYDQVFVECDKLPKVFEKFAGKEFTQVPIMKICRFQEGDYISTSTFDYSKATDEEYKKYANTNFVLQVHLNQNFEGGKLSSGLETFEVKKGYGIIQNRSTKCSLSKITEGTAYYLFVFITGYKSNNLL